MERFVPCRIVEDLNCGGCILRDSGLRKVLDDQKEAMNTLQFSTMVPDEKDGIDQRNIINLCRRVTGEKFASQLKGEFIITSRYLPPSSDFRLCVTIPTKLL